MADALRELGFELDRAELDARRAAGLPIGRPHLADAPRSPPTASAWRTTGYGETSAFLVAYLDRTARRPSAAARRRPSTRRSRRSTPRAASRSGRTRSGTSTGDADVCDAIDRFRACGLDGVEVFYVTHTPSETRLLHERCSSSVC